MLTVTKDASGVTALTLDIRPGSGKVLAGRMTAAPLPRVAPEKKPPQEEEKGFFAKYVRAPRLTRSGSGCSSALLSCSSSWAN